MSEREGLTRDEVTKLIAGADEVAVALADAGQRDVAALICSLTAELERARALPPVSRAAGGETLADLYGSVPDLIPNPMTSEAWVRRYRDGFDAGYERALSSAPAPEERHDCERWRNEGVCCSRCVEVVYGAAASPSGAGSPVAICSTCETHMENGACVNPFCKSRGWRDLPSPSNVQTYSAPRAAPPAAGREPSELLDAARALVERIDLIHANDDYRGVWSLAFAHGHRYAGPTYEAELARLRAALGASAQTNTGEAR